MTKLYTFRSKKIEQEKEKRFHFSARKYVLGSASLWAFLSVIFYFYLFDPYYATNSVLKQGISSPFFAKSVAVIILTTIFSAFIGLCISLPSLFMKYFLLFRLKKREGRGQKPVILIFFSKYIPLFLLIFFHFSFLILNFSYAPELLLKSFSVHNPLVVTALKINHLLHRSDNYDYYQSAKDISLKFNKNSNYIFLIPQDYINNISYYPKTKLLLSNRFKILLTSNFLTEVISSLFEYYPSNKSILYSPLPFVIPQDSLNHIKRVYIGTNNENTYLFHSLFSTFAETKSQQITWFDVFLNHYALSQPQLMFFFNKNIAGMLSNNWKWDSIHEQPSSLLKKYSIELSATKNQNLNSFVFHFSEHATKREHKIIEQINPLTTTEEEVNKEDKVLSKFIEGLLAENVTNIIMIPYLSDDNQPNLYQSYSYLPMDSSKVYLTNNTINERSFNTKKTKCYLKSFPPFHKNYIQNILNLVNQQNGFILLDKELKFSIKNKLVNSFACYDENNNLYLIQEDYKNSNPLNFNSEELFSRIFSIYVEHNSYSQKTKSQTKANNEKYTDNYTSEFFNQFKIYKPDLDKNILRLIQGQEKESLLKSKGALFLNEIRDGYLKNTLQE